MRKHWIYRVGWVETQADRAAKYHKNSDKLWSDSYHRIIQTFSKQQLINKNKNKLKIVNFILLIVYTEIFQT